MAPRRIQRTRAKGWKMPPNTVYVGRPSRWGNPWVVRSADGDAAYGIVIPAITAEQAVALYRDWLMTSIGHYSDLLDELRGKNLACWCRLDQPCHADTLLVHVELEKIADRGGFQILRDAGIIE